MGHGGFIPFKFATDWTCHRRRDRICVRVLRLVGPTSPRLASLLGVSLNPSGAAPSSPPLPPTGLDVRVQTDFVSRLGVLLRFLPPSSPPYSSPIGALIRRDVFRHLASVLLSGHALYAAHAAVRQAYLDAPRVVAPREHLSHLAGYCASCRLVGFQYDVYAGTGSNLCGCRDGHIQTLCCEVKRGVSVKFFVVSGNFGFALTILTNNRSETCHSSVSEASSLNYERHDGTNKLNDAGTTSVENFRWCIRVYRAGM
jgi:hypothetical protein